MFLKINRQVCLDRYPNFPQSDNENENYYFPKVCNSYVLPLKSNSPKDQSQLLGQTLIKLLQELNSDGFIFLGDHNRPWLNRENDYKSEEARHAITYFKENQIDQYFDGGLTVKKDDLQNFCVHIFWLIRCNPALPIFNFMDEGQTIVGNICQYGEIHLKTLNINIDKKVNTFLEIEGYTFVKEKST